MKDLEENHGRDGCGDTGKTTREWNVSGHLNLRGGGRRGVDSRHPREVEIRDP